MGEELADEVDGAADIDGHDEVKGIEVEGVAFAVEDLGGGC